MDDTSEVLLVARRFTVVRQRQTAADGSVHFRETVQHPGAVTILPVFEDGSVCLIRNLRIAVGRTLVELPAGTLEPGEDSAVTAHRELIEETGYRARSLTKLHEFFMSPGILNERMHLYLATGLVAGKAALEAGEEIETLIVPWQTAMRMAVDGEIQDAKTLVALLLYDRQRQTSTR